MQYIFIDESRITQNRFQLFGSLWMNAEKQYDLRELFWQLWDEEFPSRKSELKWVKVSKHKLETYKKFFDLFYSMVGIDFRCLILDKHSLDYRTYHAGSQELGFYKFLYFFISRNIEKDYHYHNKLSDDYHIFIDSRNYPREAGRLSDLRKVLNNRLIKLYTPGLSGPTIKTVDAINSKQSPEIQLVDILTGAVGYAWEGFETSTAKLEFIEHIERSVGVPLKRQTPFLTDKLNIWQFKLQNKQKSTPLPTPAETG